MYQNCTLKFKRYLRTYLLTPWCRVLLEQLTGLQLVKKFPAFHGTRTFITALTSVRHLSLSWSSPIQSIYPHPTSLQIHPNIIYPSTSRSPQWSPSLRFPPARPYVTFTFTIRINLHDLWHTKHTHTHTHTTHTHTHTNTQDYTSKSEVTISRSTVYYVI